MIRSDSDRRELSLWDYSVTVIACKLHTGNTYDVSTQFAYTSKQKMLSVNDRIFLRN